MATEREWITRDGDMVDLVAWRLFGTSVGTTERILELPQLGERPLQLPGGILLRVPDLTPAVPPKRIIRQLWD